MFHLSVYIEIELHICKLNRAIYFPLKIKEKIESCKMWKSGEQRQNVETDGGIVKGIRLKIVYTREYP